MTAERKKEPKEYKRVVEDGGWKLVATHKSVHIYRPRVHLILAAGIALVVGIIFAMLQSPDDLFEWICGVFFVSAISFVAIRYRAPDSYFRKWEFCPKPKSFGLVPIATANIMRQGSHCVVKIGEKGFIFWMGQSEDRAQEVVEILEEFLKERLTSPAAKNGRE